jgi:hypothetical protein
MSPIIATFVICLAAFCRRRVRRRGRVWRIEKTNLLLDMHAGIFISAKSTRTGQHSKACWEQNFMRVHEAICRIRTKPHRMLGTSFDLIGTCYTLRNVIMLCAHLHIQAKTVISPRAAGIYAGGTKSHSTPQPERSCVHLSSKNVRCPAIPSSRTSVTNKSPISLHQPRLPVPLPLYPPSTWRNLAAIGY